MKYFVIGMKSGHLSNYLSAFYSLFVLAVVFVRLNGSAKYCVECDGDLKLWTDGPAVFDATLAVMAKVENAEQFTGPFYFSFSKLKKIHF